MLGFAAAVAFQQPKQKSAEPITIFAELNWHVLTFLRPNFLVCRVK
jgi:hypothetical protein